MTLTIFLDTGPLGIVTNPKANQETKECVTWLKSCLANGARVCIPEICDYELRRELIRADKAKGLGRLDAIIQSVDYVPLSTAMMRKAAEFWANARKSGKPTAPDHALDGDVILAAQAALSVTSEDELVVATTNIGHLATFVNAKLWRDITPA